MALNFELSEEQRLIKETVSEMLDQFEPRRNEIREQVFKEKKFPQEIWDAFAEIGLQGCLIPEEYGGSDLGLLPMALSMEEMASRGFGNTVLILTAMDSLCILRNGSEELKQRFLPKIASGDMKLCFAVTEPEAGSNTFRITTHARKDGDEYVINGSKIWITGADVTDYMLLVTRTTTVAECKEQQLPKAYGLSLFLVDTKVEGLRLDPLPVRGIEGYRQFQLFFEDCRVPAENLVGHENAGVQAIFNSLNPERILAASVANGMTQFALERAVEYSKDRKVFGGRPIGAHQAIQHPLAEIRIELEACRLLAYQSAWSFDREDPLATTGTYANMAKYKAAELAIHAVDRAIQTHGGAGFSEEYELIHLWDAARLLRTAPITKEMILNFVGEHVLEMPRSY